MNRDEKRTQAQNNAIHKYCDMVAQDMTDAGYTDLRDFLTQPFEIPIIRDTVKKMIWHKVQFALTGKESSKDLAPSEVDFVYQVMSKHLAETKQITTEFPSKERLER